MNRDFRFFKDGRFLKKIRPFFFFTLVGFSAFASSESIEGRINRAAFPLSRFAGRYEALPKSVEREIREKTNQALEPIRLAPTSWFRASFGIVPNTSDRKRIIDSIEDTEIWKCVGGDCRGCPGDDPLGCVLSTKRLGGVGVVALIHPCLVGEGNCPRKAKPDSKVWIEKIIPTIAFYKAAVPGGSSALRKAQKASSHWVYATSVSVNKILGACPGPYAADSMRFLLSLDSVTSPNTAVQRCGEKYFSELRSLPATCPKLKSLQSREWEDFAKKNLAKVPEILRCDSYCRKLLCRTSSVKAIFTQFSGSPTLLLADGACEGEKATDVPAFLRDAVPSSLRSQLESFGCIAKESSIPAESGSTKGSSDGPDVNLVE